MVGEQEQDRVLRQTGPAWKRLKADKSWSDWLAVAEGLSIIQHIAMREAGTNKNRGARYNEALTPLLETYGVGDMPRIERHYALEVMKHRAEIEVWRSTLTPIQQRKLNHPHSVLRSWKAAMSAQAAEVEPKEPKPTVRAALHEAEDRESELVAKVKRLERQIAQADFDRAGVIDNVVRIASEDIERGVTYTIDRMSADGARAFAEALLARLPVKRRRVSA